MNLSFSCKNMSGLVYQNTTFWVQVFKSLVQRTHHCLTRERAEGSCVHSTRNTDDLSMRALHAVRRKILFCLLKDALHLHITRSASVGVVTRKKEKNDVCLWEQEEWRQFGSCWLKNPEQETHRVKQVKMSGKQMIVLFSKGHNCSEKRIWKKK